jgi:DNA repair protein RadD
MPKILRPYQEACLKSLFDFLYKKQGQPLIVAPVGAGKSLIIAEFILRVHADFPRTRIVLLTHVKELLQQNAEELREQYPTVDMGFYCAGLGQKRLHNDVTFASIQSIHNKIDAFNRCPEIIIIDEAHLISHNDQTQYRKFINSVLAINQNCKVIGLTGTPFRSDTGRLDEGDGALFTEIAYEIEMKYMIEQGFWARPVTPKTKYVMDIKGVGTRNGDYIAGQLEKKIDVDDVTRACIEELLFHAQDRRKVLVFTAGVQHCEHVRDCLREHGQSAEMVTGDTDPNERKQIITDYKAGKFKYLVNVAVLTTGFNVPDIDCLCFMRPTRSPVLYIQCVGRGVRTVYADGFDINTPEGRLSAISESHKKDCMIVDFGGVVSTLGPIDSLDIRKKNSGANKEEDEKGEAIMKVCPSCGAECFAAQKFCYNCSYSFISDSLTSAGQAAVTTIDIEPEWLPVMTMQVQKHIKKDAPNSIPSMCVIYGTMIGTVREWICFEHYKYGEDDKKFYAYKQAIKWFFARFPNGDVPKEIDDALKYEWPIPSEILAKKDGKFWRVLDYRFERDDSVVDDFYMEEF